MDIELHEHCTLIKVSRSVTSKSLHKVNSLSSTFPLPSSLELLLYLVALVFFWLTLEIAYLVLLL